MSDSNAYDRSLTDYRLDLTGRIPTYHKEAASEFEHKVPRFCPTEPSAQNGYGVIEKGRPGWFRFRRGRLPTQDREAFEINYKPKCGHS